jgi:hypothetical protein
MKKLIFIFLNEEPIKRLKSLNDFTYSGKIIKNPQLRKTIRRSNKI